MKPIHWIVLAGVLVVLAIAYFVFDPFGGSSSANALATTALTSPDKKARVDAVQELGMRKDKNQALPALKRVATETKDPEIKAFALTNIVYFMDRDSLPIFFKSLEDEDRQIRKAAYDGLMTYFSKQLPGGVVYEVDGPPAARAAAAKKLQDEIDKPAMP